MLFIDVLLNVFLLVFLLILFCFWVYYHQQQHHHHHNNHYYYHLPHYPSLPALLIGCLLVGADRKCGCAQGHWCSGNCNTDCPQGWVPLNGKCFSPAVQVKVAQCSSVFVLFSLFQIEFCSFTTRTAHHILTSAQIHTRAHTPRYAIQIGYQFHLRARLYRRLQHS